MAIPVFAYGKCKGFWLEPLHSVCNQYSN